MDRIKVGKFVKTRGLKGEIRVYSYADYKEKFEEYPSIQVEGTEYYIKKVSYSKETPILLLDTIDTIEKAEKLIGKDIYVDRVDTLPEDDEFLIIDLIGLDAITEEGVKFGVVKDVLVNQHHDIIVIDVDGEEKLIPSVEEFVLEIDFEAGFIRINLIEGL